MAVLTEDPIATLPKLSNEEIARYSRHLILPEVGMEGQQKLNAARVLCVGTGGLGAPLALYLAAAGVGTIGLVDFDTVDASNLQRQVIHSTATVGMLKVDSAEIMLKGLNPHLNVVKYNTMLTSANALEIFKDFDVIADGTDNFQTRYLVNDACVLTGKPNAYGSIFRFEGQASVFGTEEGPCYRCLYPEPPPPGLVPSCAEGGVLGILPGLVGIIQATGEIAVATVTDNFFGFAQQQNQVTGQASGGLTAVAVASTNSISAYGINLSGTANVTVTSSTTNATTGAQSFTPTDAIVFTVEGFQQSDYAAPTSTTTTTGG